MSLIRNSKQVRQSIDFTGIESGKIHPTDIDVVLEFDNEVLILMEVKRKGNKIPTGQSIETITYEEAMNLFGAQGSMGLYEEKEVNDPSENPIKLN